MENRPKVGKPLKFKSPEDLEILIQSYFNQPKILDETEIPDVEGLAYYLETSRKTLIDYESKEDYSYAIKTAKNRIAYLKKQLAWKGKVSPAVFCFDFKNNHDYVDKQEVAHTGADGMPLTVIVHRGADRLELSDSQPEQISNAEYE